MVSNEEYDKSAKKFVVRIAYPPPRVEITIRMDIDADHKHEPIMECILTSEFLDKMKYQEAPMQPYTIGRVKK